MRNNVAQQIAIGYCTRRIKWPRRYIVAKMTFGPDFYLVFLATILMGLAGCTRFHLSQAKTYLTVPEQPNQNASKAKKLNAEGLVKLEKGKVAEAEELFRQSLAEDIDYGPAHNNLGQIYLCRNELYLAAWEFEFASNLMPDRPECLVNLGLVYEKANRLQDAATYYESALEIQPAHVTAIANLARVDIKMDADKERTRGLLQQLVMMDRRPQWNRWARDMLAIRFGDFGTGEPSWGEDGIVEEISPKQVSEPSSTKDASSREDLPAPIVPLRLNPESTRSMPRANPLPDDDTSEPLTAVAKELPPSNRPIISGPVLPPRGQ